MEHKTNKKQLNIVIVNSFVHIQRVNRIKNCAEISRNMEKEIRAVKFCKFLC